MWRFAVWDVVGNCGHIVFPFYDSIVLKTDARKLSWRTMQNFRNKLIEVYKF